MNDYTVYMHIAPNGKKYIGITKQKLYRRFRRGKGYKDNDYFCKAIGKYGWDNFIHEILYENLTQDEAEKKEILLIKLYRSNTRKYGYNIENGGHSRGKVSLSTRKKLHDVNVGKKLSEECKGKLRKANLGKKHSSYTKMKMSFSHLGMQNSLGVKQSEETKRKKAIKVTGVLNGNARPVDQYDLNGNFIKHWDYMKLIVEHLNISSNAHVTECCQGKRNKAYGYIWKYSN